MLQVEAMLIEGGGSEEQLRTAWQHIGDNLARQCNWKQVSCVIHSIAHGYSLASAQCICKMKSKYSEHIKSASCTVDSWNMSILEPSRILE